MICSNPNYKNKDKDFPENLIHESHDVPCYLFKGITRNERKNQADKFGRRWLCIQCHENYEDALRSILQTTSIGFSMQYFKEEKKNDTAKTPD